MLEIGKALSAAFVHCAWVAPTFLRIAICPSSIAHTFGIGFSNSLTVGGGVAQPAPKKENPASIVIAAVKFIAVNLDSFFLPSKGDDHSLLIPILQLIVGLDVDEHVGDFAPVCPHGFAHGMGDTVAFAHAQFGGYSDVDIDVKI